MVTRTPSSSSSPQLSDHAATLWAGRRVVLVVLAVFLLGAFAWAKTRQPVYASSVDVLVGPGTVGAAEGQPDLDTEVDLAESRAVAELALNELRPDLTRLDQVVTGLNVSRASEGRVLRFNFKASTPQIAQEGALDSADAYLGFRSGQIRTNMIDRRQKVLLRRDSLNTQLLQLTDIIATNPKDSIAAINARDQKAGVLIQLEDIRHDLAEIALLDLSPGQVIGTPSAPKAVSLPLAGVLFAGGLIGLLLGCVLAFANEGLRGRVRGTHEIEDQFGSPVLGIVPLSRDLAREDRRKQLQLETDPEGFMAEAFRVLRSSVLQHSGPDARVFLVTSGEPAEGKSTIAANLAVRIAGSGKQVLLVDADLRRPSLHQYFAVGNRNGLRHLLQDETRGLPISITGYPGLALIASGPPTAASADHFEADSFRRVVDRLRPLADYIVIDAPPVFVSDTVLMAPVVDGIIFVVNAGRATRRSLGRSRDLLDRLGLHATGIVLNSYEGGPGSEFGYRPYRYETKGIKGATSHDSETRRRPKRGGRRTRGRGDDSPGLREAIS